MDLHPLLQIVVIGLVFWCLWWGLGKIALPEPFNKIAVVVLVLGTLYFLIPVILSLGGGGHTSSFRW